jgi:DNA mismatch endonuclease, patch repair protein
MKANRRTGTRPEAHLRSALHKTGLRFRKDVYLRIGTVRTKADVVFPRQRVAVYLDGCFWHRCPEHGQLPRANRSYWQPKLERNAQRDREITEALRKEGWIVIRIWEHEELAPAVQRIGRVVRQRAESG